MHELLQRANKPLSICLSVCLSILPIYLSIYLPIYLHTITTHTHIYIYICRCVYVSLQSKVILLARVQTANLVNCWDNANIANKVQASDSDVNGEYVCVCADTANIFIDICGHPPIPMMISEAPLDFPSLASCWGCAILPRDKTSNLETPDY